MMSLTFGLFTQVRGSGPLGPLVCVCACVCVGGGGGGGGRRGCEKGNNECYQKDCSVSNCSIFSSTFTEISIND